MPDQIPANSFMNNFTTRFGNKMNENWLAAILFPPAACAAGFAYEYLIHERKKEYDINKFGENTFKNARHSWQIYRGTKWGFIAVSLPYIAWAVTSLIETVWAAMNKSKSETPK
jgi:hypothetical protein